MRAPVAIDEPISRLCFSFWCRDLSFVRCRDREPLQGRDGRRSSHSARQHQRAASRTAQGAAGGTGSKEGTKKKFLRARCHAAMALPSPSAAPLAPPPRASSPPPASVTTTFLSFRVAPFWFSFPSSRMFSLASLCFAFCLTFPFASISPPPLLLVQHHDRRRTPTSPPPRRPSASNRTGSALSLVVPSLLSHVSHNKSSTRYSTPPSRDLIMRSFEQR